jgi:hypothetical protein
MIDKSRPLGVTLLSLFFIFGALMSGLTAIMLLFPHSMLEPLWRLNPHAREGFTAMGLWAVLLMGVVSISCTTAAIGLWRLARWGYWTALAILTINVIGDTANVWITRDWRTLVGLPIGGAMIAYLINRRWVFAME